MDDAFAPLLASPAAYVFAALLGALWGSFANVCIARLPRGMSVVRPASHCFACGHPVRWFDNLPIVSYFLLRGRCRSCGARYSARYVLVEAGLALLFLATWHLCVALVHPEELAPARLARFAIYAFFELTLVVIAFIDLDTKRILDRITYPGIPIFFGLGLALGDHEWTDLAIGVAVGYGVVRLISDGYYYLTRREGMGYGDGKLLALIGALLGWRAVVFALFGGSVIGSVIGVAAIAWQRRGGQAPDGTPLRHVEIPFGPFLVAAALVYLFLQQQIDVGVRTLWFPEA
jgi:leader peptidase (prepilin peptidase)/N-methyltransferase